MLFDYLVLMLQVPFYVFLGGGGVGGVGWGVGGWGGVGGGWGGGWGGGCFRGQGWAL